MGLYLHKRFFILLLVGVFALIMAYCFPVIYKGVACLLVLGGFCIAADLILLFGFGQMIEAVREVPDKLSNGDENRVTIRVESRYRFPVCCRIIDEIPPQFQKRDLEIHLRFPVPGKQVCSYSLVPVRRGEYHFGRVRVFASSPLSLVMRRYSFVHDTLVAVYPSFLNMHKYELMAVANQQQECGSKQTRHIGGNMAFEQIKPYVFGDDPRTVNWKATAKCDRLMVNTYTEERAQQIYCLIDKGRTMQMPFNGMAMLDHAINATLALTATVLKKGDKAGLLTFSNTFGSLVKADHKSGQMNRINEMLYNQRTHFLETDFEQLYVQVRRQVNMRSLLVLFTNFETVDGMRRQLPALCKLASKHLVLLVLFENSELNRVLKEPSQNIQDVYFQTIAGSFALEKKQMLKELRHYGVNAILTEPESLTVSAINAYLELKKRNLI